MSVYLLNVTDDENESNDTEFGILCEDQIKRGKKSCQKFCKSH